MGHALWRSHRPPADVVKSPPTHAERVAEQNAAAGGQGMRAVTLPDGQTATASIRLLLFEKARRIYAYLHFRTEGRNVTRYIGEATADDRAEALRIAWNKAHRRGLLADPFGSGYRGGARTGGKMRPRAAR
jgi:hypothetical protein